MKRVALYVRVSTKEQKIKGLSVDNQSQALTEYANANNYKVVDIYNDAGISARKRYTKRPSLLRLIEDVKAGKIDLILFTKLDRWFRSVADYYEVQSVLDQYKIPWRAIHEDYETETTNGIFKVNIMLSVAQQEADRTSDRIKSIMQYKRERGDYTGSAPTGYKVVKKDLVKDDKKADGISAMFRIYLDTFSSTKACLKAQEYGLKITQVQFLKMCNNPTYSGHTTQGYECEPYLTDAEWNKIQNHLKQYTRQPKVKDRFYLFAGVCTCGHCGKKLNAKPVRRGNNYYHYYVCQYYSSDANHPYIQISEKKLEAYLLSQFDKIHLEQVEIIEKRNEAVGCADAEKEKNKLEAKLKRLAILFEDGDMDADTYRAKRDAIKQQLIDLEIDKTDVPAPLPNNWKDIYNELDAEHRSIFWHSIIKSMTFDIDAKHRPQIVLY